MQRLGGLGSSEIMVGAGRRVLGGALWMYGSQVASLVAQFVYAALTSRLVSAEGFGQYGIALTVSALISLLANGGLGKAAGRMTKVDGGRLKALTLYGLLLGAIGSFVLLLTASFWAHIWGAPEAVGTVRLLFISALLSPCCGLATGLLMRQGNFRSFAAATFITNLVGMLVGILSVLTWRNAGSLLISPIVAQILLTLYAYARNWRLLVGPAHLHHARADMSFSWKLTAASLFSYVNGNLGRWTVSVSMGPGALGQWNRADVLTSVPFQQVQNVLVRAIYPEFRHDLASRARARRVWPDLLILSAWGVWPLAAGAAVVVPDIVPVLFGPGWEMTAQMVALLMLLSGLQVVTVILASALEALSKFRWIWFAQSVVLVFNLAGALIGYLRSDWLPVLTGIGVGYLFQHALHIFFSIRAGYLDGTALAKGYLVVLFASVLTALIAFATSEAIRQGSSISIVLALMSFLLAIILLFISGKRFPPLVIAKRYRIIR